MNSVSNGLEEGLRIYHRNWDHSFYEECPAANLVDLLHVFTCGEKRIDHGGVLRRVMCACEKEVAPTDIM